MTSRIDTQIILAVGAVTALTIGTLGVLVVRAHRAALIAELQTSADQLSETIKSATLHDMLANSRENLQRQMDTIGSQRGIRNVRVYNKEGRIVFSSDRSEVGRSVDKRAEACYACHAADRPLEHLSITARARDFRDTDGAHLLGIINPIANQPSCSEASCHAHSPEARVLGVLDVSMSLAEVDRNIRLSQIRMAGIATVAIVAASLILFWLNRRLVVLPVQTLVSATRRVAEGDLATRIPVTARHELGDLARAFNEMVARLAEDQRKIVQADKLASVGRLAAGVAHEINNPLTGVLTYASFLLKRAGDQPELRADLEVIVRETKRCREIVRGLLDFARQTTPRRQPTDINAVVRHAVSIVTNEVALRHVELAVDLAQGLPELAVEADRLEQVFVNLLVNAADAAPEEGGRVTISSRQVNVPAAGHSRITSATCPKGCDLIDPTLRIRGVPAIRVLRACAGREAILHLDPTYGRFGHLAAEACDEGLLADFACARCRTSLALTDAGGVCPRCGAGLFGVNVPGAGQVAWCRRIGCHFTLWEAEEQRGLRAVVEIAVEDNGRGMTGAELAQLFEPFFTTKGARGTGLGLAVSWGIVESHGGTIDVVSEAERGTRFAVRLPLTVAAREA